MNTKGLSADSLFFLREFCRPAFVETSAGKAIQKIFLKNLLE
jgi:hypothetical protein